MILMEPDNTIKQVENKIPVVDRKVPNPEGKGGFKDNPENINMGGRPKNEVSIVYWIKEYLKGKEDGHEKERAQELAEKICSMAYLEGNVVLMKEILERIEGKTPWKIEGNIGEGLSAVAQALDKIIKEDGEQTPTSEPVTKTD
jgi:hypothetical protein